MITTAQPRKDIGAGVGSFDGFALGGLSALVNGVPPKAIVPPVVPMAAAASVATNAAEVSVAVNAAAEAVAAAEEENDVDVQRIRVKKYVPKADPSEGGRRRGEKNTGMAKMTETLAPLDDFGGVWMYFRFFIFSLLVVATAGILYWVFLDAAQ